MDEKIYKNLEEAFDASVLDRARGIVRSYRIIIEENDKLGFVGSSVELPMVFADGKTEEQCLKSIREALVGTVATMIECGKTVPTGDKRTEQVNIRLTPYEKLVLTQKATDYGFKGLADLLRSKIIATLLKAS